MRYLTVGEVIRISEVEVGEDVLADFGALDAAVQRPQQSVFGADAYPDIHHKAAALLHSIARNHPFVDGNKRVAAASALVFYALNGWAVPGS
jgi:death-on-curing protein